MFTPGATPGASRRAGEGDPDDHPWFLIFAVVAAVGMIFQFQVNRSYEVTVQPLKHRWAASRAPPSDAMA